MFLFREEELSNIINRKNKKSVIDSLIIETKDVLDNEIKIPTEGIGSWGLYYFCPIHSVRLEFDIASPKKHICPIDGEILTGEPYDSSWWGLMNKRNASACHNLALLWLLTGEDKYLDKAKIIILEYAKYYPSYEVHGDIPYNGPGKANAQTLDEAVWIRDIAYGYDLIADEFTDRERKYIFNNLFLQCAEFLKEHRANQIHNHEVIINSSIGILGIMLDREDYINFALYEKYGLMYQLNNAVLKDGIWFEISIHYHYYALEAFFSYEKFARHTKYSNLDKPRYLEMVVKPYKLLQDDFHVPPINDSMLRNEECLEHLDIFEFAYAIYKNEYILAILNRQYEKSERNNLHSFFYGVEELPKSDSNELEEYHDEEGSGLTVIRGNDKKYFLFKHSPFAGEHDHYDRLNIMYRAYGDRILADLGTTGYGAKLHYDYFKNTASHNTVMINEENQPPAETKVLYYEKNPQYTVIDTEVEWNGEYKGLDSYIIAQWDEESYKDVTMRRIIIWTEDYIIDVFKVMGVNNYYIDHILNIPGLITKNYLRDFQDFDKIFSEKKPLRYYNNIICRKNTNEVIRYNWEFNNCSLNHYSRFYDDGDIYIGEAPDNPSIKNISKIINRIKGDSALFINIYDVYNNETHVKNAIISCSHNDITINLDSANEMIQYNLKLTDERVYIETI